MMMLPWEMLQSSFGVTFSTEVHCGHPQWCDAAEQNERFCSKCKIKQS